MGQQEVRLPELEWSGERYVPQLEGNIKLEHVHRYLIARVSCRGQRVLDIACGEGYGSALLADVASLVIGVDIAPDAIAHASRRYGQPHLTFLTGHCAAIPLSDGSVDVVVSFETIEHHDRHDEMMREIKRVLRPGGLLIMSSPDRREYSDVPGHSNPFHVRELYRDEFERLLGDHFVHVAVAGQRVKAGSFVWPLDKAAQIPFEGHSAGTAGGPVEPLGEPMYLLAQASDESVPPIPCGLLDGGAFLWPADHAEALRVSEYHHGEALRVAAYRHSEELRATEQTHHIRVNELSEARADAEQDSARLRDEIESTRTASATLKAQVDDLASKVARLEVSLVALEKERGQLRESVQGLTHAVEGLEVERRQLEGGRRQLDAERRKLEELVRVMEHSHSWRLTAPLRALRRRLGP